MAVKIPVHLVPRAYVDYDMEQQQILRHSFVLRDGFRVPPLTAGRLMALELISSEFFLRPGSCTQFDIGAALVLMTCRQHLVEDFTRKSQSASEAADNPSAGSACRGLSATYPKLAQTASALFEAHADAILADYPALVRWCAEVPFYGYDMLPKQGSGASKPCWFDGEFAGSVLAPASKILSTPFEMILWDTPLCIVWHAIAQQAAAFGTKGVERPPDKAVLKKMAAEAQAREERGELHHWQFEDPIGYGLTAVQFKANPALAPFFKKILADFERGGGKPLNPADYPLPTAPVSGDSTTEPSGMQDACPTITVQAQFADCTEQGPVIYL